MYFSYHMNLYDQMAIVVKKCSLRIGPHYDRHTRTSTLALNLIGHVLLYAKLTNWIYVYIS